MLVFLRLRVSNSYVWGLVFFRLGVRFLTFGGYFSYVWGLAFLFLLVWNSYVWGFLFLRLEISFLTFLG